MESVSISRKFVSEEEIQEARQKRQAEWKKVLEESGQNPETAKLQEEVYDPRTLYERLQEQKMKKEETFQELTRFSNLVHRLDEDEIDFLAALENEERTKELDKLRKEKEELEEFRRAAMEADSTGVILSSPVVLPLTSQQPKLDTKTVGGSLTNNPIKPDMQRLILMGAVKRKNSNSVRKKLFPESSQTVSNERSNKRLKLDDDEKSISKRNSNKFSQRSGGNSLPSHKKVESEMINSPTYGAQISEAVTASATIVSSEKNLVNPVKHINSSSNALDSILVYSDNEESD
ncbi:hypothetical protein G9A89_005060 [Geosiphon pyriformis]|nr:hypothetical protein G9A89_005060 [Geosiphon pyriformis]